MSDHRRALRTVTRTQGNNRDLKQGAVAPEGLRLAFEEVPVLVQAFRRMVREHEFDVCEMALTTYLCARAHGARFTALPIFLVRGLHHGAIVQRAGASLTPGDLEGRRIGVNRGYTVTTGVWARGILAREYGVDLERVTWVPSGDEHVASYRHPENVDTTMVGTDLRQLLAEGRVDAGVGVTAEADDGLEPVIPDPQDAALGALADHGLYPINHLVVVRDDVLDEDRGVATALFEAFAESKRRYVRRLGTSEADAPTAADRMHQQVADIAGGDPLPYGIEPNRAMLDRLIDHAMDQRIIEQRPRVEDLFVPSTHDLVA